jgi:hypothetical protein
MGTSSAARQFVTWAPLAALLIVLLPTFSAAQEPVKSFDQLNTRLKPGDTVWITDAQGREVKGRIRDLGPSALTLDGTGTIAADAVQLITERLDRPIGKGALWGLATGAVVGAVSGATADEETGFWMLVGAVFYGGIGAGVGALAGACTPGKSLVVYRAPGSTGAAHARLSIAPVITPRTKGVALSYSF